MTAPSNYGNVTGLTTVDAGTINYCSWEKQTRIASASWLRDDMDRDTRTHSQALALSREIFGDGSIEMVPPFLLLSEANLGLGLLQSAEEFLSMANWSILKTPQCSNAVRSQVTCCTLGKSDCDDID